MNRFGLAVTVTSDRPSGKGARLTSRLDLGSSPLWASPFIFLFLFKSHCLNSDFPLHSE